MSSSSTSTPVSERAPAKAPRRGPGRPSGTGAGKPDRREELIQAARSVLSERGLPRLTVKAVADRAGVKPALVHYYFGGRDGLIREITERAAAGVRDRLVAIAGAPGRPEDRIGEIVAAIVGAIGEDEYLPRLIVEQVLFAEDEVIDHFVENFAKPNLLAIASILRSGSEAGTLRAVDAKFFVPSALGMSLFFFIAAPIVKRIFDIDEYTPELREQFSRATAELLLHGIEVPETAPVAGGER